MSTEKEFRASRNAEGENSYTHFLRGREKGTEKDCRGRGVKEKKGPQGRHWCGDLWTAGWAGGRIRSESKSNRFLLRKGVQKSTKCHELRPSAPGLRRLEKWTCENKEGLLGRKAPGKRREKNLLGIQFTPCGNSEKSRSREDVID